MTLLHLGSAVMQRKCHGMWSQTGGQVLALQMKYCVAWSRLLNLSELQKCAMQFYKLMPLNKVLNKQKSSSFQDLFPSVLLGLVGLTNYRLLEAQISPLPYSSHPRRWGGFTSGQFPKRGLARQAFLLTLFSPSKIQGSGRDGRNSFLPGRQVS